MSGSRHVIKQEDLSGRTFRDIDAMDLTLLGCTCDADEPPIFKGCSGRLAIMGGKLPGLTLRDCSLSDFTVREASLARARLQRTDIDRGRLHHCDLTDAQFRAVSFATLLSEQVRFDASYGVDVGDFLAMWMWPRRRVTAQRALVVSAPRNGFTDYLNSEYKRAVTYDHAVEDVRPLAGAPSRIGRSLLPILLLATTNFGASIARWLVTSAAMVLLFALLIGLSSGVGSGDATRAAMQLLLNRSTEMTLPASLELSGAAIGLFLFALLVAIVGNRFIDRY